MIKEAIIKLSKKQDLTYTEAEDGEVMAVEHTEYPVYGVQFHPESVMTPDGKLMIQNFMATVHR